MYLNVTYRPQRVGHKIGNVISYWPVLHHLLCTAEGPERIVLPKGIASDRTVDAGPTYLQHELSTTYFSRADERASGASTERRRFSDRPTCIYGRIKV